MVSTRAFHAGPLAKLMFASPVPLGSALRPSLPPSSALAKDAYKHLP